MFDQRPLGHLIAHHTGGGTPSRQIAGFWNGSIPWASVKDFSDDQIAIAHTEEYISPQGLAASASNLIPEKTVVICTRMAVGRAAITEVPLAINQDLKALFPNRGVCERYLLRLLHWVKERAESQAVGSTVKGIRVADLLGLNVPIAPEVDQPVIADILDTLDIQIRQTEAIIAKLQQVKQGLLHDLLTRGIDATGQLRLPREQAPELYKESPLGWIPREWEALTFGELARYTNGYSFNAEQWKDNGLPIIRIQNLNGEPSFNYYQGPTKEEWFVRTGDLLFAWSGQRGVSFGSRIWGGPEGVLNQHIFKVWTEEQLVSKKFLHLLLKFRQTAIEDSAHGFKDSFLHVTKGELTSVVAGVPSLQEQEALCTVIDSHDEKIGTNSELLKKLKQQKSGLMDDLLTGRVRVTPLANQQLAS